MSIIHIMSDINVFSTKKYKCKIPIISTAETLSGLVTTYVDSIRSVKELSDFSETYQFICNKE